jgi:hypothetical protein
MALGITTTTTSITTTITRLAVVVLTCSGDDGTTANPKVTGGPTCWSTRGS